MRLRDFQRDFNKNFSKNLNKVTDLMGDLATDVVEQVNSPKAKAALNSALDVLRPHFLSLGARISILSSSQVELTLPRKKRNLDEHNQILPEVQISAAVEAYRMLWRRNASEGEFQIVIKDIQAKLLKFSKSNLKIRGELSDITRESKWAELARYKRSTHEMTLHLFDEQDQICTEIDIQSEIYLKEMLEWK
jgi:hypothetical protein